MSEIDDTKFADLLKAPQLSEIERKRLDKMLKDRANYSTALDYKGDQQITGVKK